MANDIQIIWDETTGTGDINFDKGDFSREDSLSSAVLMSLFTDRRADDDDFLPDELNGSKRGWWADLVTDIDDDQIGSRLWLLSRSKTDTQTLNDAQDYANEALQWLIDDGIAIEIISSASRVRLNSTDLLALDIEIRKSDGETETFKFDDLWAAQIAST